MFKQYCDEQARTLLDDLGRWLRGHLLILPLQSETAKAINYFLSRSQALIYYCDDGVVQIDDNIVGRAANAFEVTIKHANITKVLVTAVRYRTDTIGG
ncbi:transposase [Paraburkholderia sp. RL18-101-BIB-B]|uniref:IS66 family transposase n=1 Tax=unclassified Paraburkholderia TaxID=2615204 RepID=UPI0038BAE0A8